MTLGNLLNFSLLQFPLLYNAVTAVLPWWVAVLNEMAHHERVLNTIPGMLQLLSIADFKEEKAEQNSSFV